MIQAAVWKINSGQQKRKLRIQVGIYETCEKWFNAGCILEEELKGLAGGLDLEWRGGEESKMSPKFLFGATWKMVVPFNEIGKARGRATLG